MYLSAEGEQLFCANYFTNVSIGSVALNHFNRQITFSKLPITKID